MACVSSPAALTRLLTFLSQRSQGLLAELKTAGHITAYATWKPIYPRLEADERYQNLLGTPGSTPLDLFWDVVDALDCQAEEDQRAVEGVLEERKHRVGEETTYEQFEEFLEGHERMKKVDYVVLKAAYDKVRFVRLVVG